MRVLFLGTDKFAVPSLEAVSKKYDVVAVITQPDKPRGRGRKVSSTPVKEAAYALGIPVLEPKSLKKKSFKEELEGINYDIVVLVAYGKILPEGFIDKPIKGCICVHPSMLPEYRGCSPIERAILDGKEETGISVFYIDKEIDCGAIIHQEEFEIYPQDTGGILRHRLSVESPKVLLKALELIEKGQSDERMQDSCKSSYAPKICKQDAHISWDESAFNINNKVRAYNPKPGAYTIFKDKRLKILKGEVVSWEGEKKIPGTILEIVKNKGFIVQCSEGCLLVLELQPEGKGVMEAWAYVLGHCLKVGDKFIY